MRMMETGRAGGLIFDVASLFSSLAHLRLITHSLVLKKMNERERLRRLNPGTEIRT